MKTQDVWNLYADDLKYFIFSKTKNKTITDDLLQESFIKIHAKLNDLKDYTKLKAWVFSIARHTVYDYFKSDSKQLATDEFPILIEEQNQGHSEKDCLYAHILNLDKKYRTPLFLSDVKGLKQTDIANQLNLPLPTIKSRIQRARKKVAEGYMLCCDYSLNEQGVLVGEHKEKEDCKICR